ncbi:MAG TPA: EAL domain-containing protein [Candidatus Omnitrophota bacterium]|nr:EAL domain-containing protein [Candidatus Omnitrophota bacterium]HPD85555.1 EAL domain-containing protein [Candidatus Omnitrophota bacterium]HRZ04405.1 EAL domain-containing protein [Candidatus Omnitrophota bacterium]
MTNKKRVLIVDDERNIAQMMSLILETRGYEVDIADSGSAAIEKAMTKPDLILLDLILPDVEGFEVCRRLREGKTTRHIPIIIVSVKYLFEDKIEGLYLGADDYLTKPFDHEELLARMEAVLRRSVFFDESTSDNEVVILELKKIVKEELVIPFYQPIFFLKPFRIFGFEALSRPPIKSILSNPELLFKAALRFGLYCDLEMISWQKALESMPRCSEEARLFLNCNPFFVESPKFFKIKSIFDKNNVNPKNIVLELTERSLVSDYNSFYERLRFYRNYGFDIAIDDVGGGYASLESIVEIRPSVVKIDIHLIQNLKNDPIRRSLVKFIVSFCKENNIISIAEGIEQKEDLDILIDLGVDAGQGYLLCRPTHSVNLEEIYKDIRVRLNIDDIPGVKI